MRNTALLPTETVSHELSTPFTDGSSAFEMLAMPLLGSAYNLARWLTRNPCDADDLVQETYLKALRSFSSFQPGTNFQAWLLRILRNTFLSSRQSLEYRKTIALASEEDSAHQPAVSETPESFLLESHTIESIQRAIEQLPPAYREIILLSDLEETSYRQMAEILSIPIGTVMSRLARARKMIRENIRSDSRKGLSHPVHGEGKSRAVGQSQCLSC